MPTMSSCVPPNFFFVLLDLGFLDSFKTLTNVYLGYQWRRGFCTKGPKRATDDISSHQE